MHAVLHAFFASLHKLEFKKKTILSELVFADTRKWHLLLARARGADAMA